MSNSIQIDQPSPGHYIISGLRSGSVAVEGGQLVFPPSCHITPDVPSDVLLQILSDRGDITPGPVLTAEEMQEDIAAAADSAQAAGEDKPKRHRRTKAEMEADAAKEAAE